MRLRTLLSALRRRHTPVPPPRQYSVGELQMAIVADTSEFIDVLPHRTPGLDGARRHALTGAQRGRDALHDVDLYADASQDPARAEEAHVRQVAALHQLDDALAELADARRTLENLR